LRRENGLKRRQIVSGLRRKRRGRGRRERNLSGKGSRGRNWSV